MRQRRALVPSTPILFAGKNKSNCNAKMVYKEVTHWLSESGCLVVVLQASTAKKLATYGEQVYKTMKADDYERFFPSENVPIPNGAMDFKESYYTNYKDLKSWKVEKGWKVTRTIFFDGGLPDNVLLTLIAVREEELFRFKIATITETYAKVKRWGLVPQFWEWVEDRFAKQALVQVVLEVYPELLGDLNDLILKRVK